MKRTMRKLIAVVAMIVMLFGVGVSSAWAQSLWSQVGILSSVNTLDVFNGTLYAGADSGVWTLNGSSWTQQGSSLQTVTSLAMVSSTLYAGTLMNGVWAWNGSSWTQQAGLSGASADVSALAVFNGLLFVGTANGVYIRYANGQYANIGFANTPVPSLLPANGVLYAGISGEGVYYYNMSTWAQYGNNNPSLDNVASLIQYKNLIYAGTNGGGVWNCTGTTWIQAGTSSAVSYAYALATYNGTLYAATRSGVWATTDGTTWSQVGTLTSWLSTVATMNSILYAGNVNVWAYQL